MTQAAKPLARPEHSRKGPPAMFNSRGPDQDILRRMDAELGSQRLADRTLQMYERAASVRKCTTIEAMSQMLGGWRL